MKRTALYDKHIAMGAKMVPFAGYEMPVRYSSDIEEHMAVREGVGVFDVSHMGEFFLRGPKAFDLVQRVTSNDASKMYDGKAMYAYLPNETGGIVDDLIVYRISEEEYLLVVNASNIEKDWNWISKYNTEGVKMENASDQMSLFAVQGPKATTVLKKLTDADLDSMKFYTFQKGKVAGIEDVIISATGYTGAGGFELYVANEYAERLWDALFEAGAEEDIKPIGLGARDTLRLEMGYCLYGNDIDDTTCPIEAGLGWVTKFSKVFTNSEYLQERKESGGKQKLVGLLMVDKGIPRKDYEIYNAEDEVIGRITSGTQSPVMKQGIGMGYVTKDFAKTDTEVFVGVRNRRLKAKVVKPPFV
ncbi:glycine cleavage system aminomethyltransferase GcvT [Catalinimonas niigatensis]|uniref:glycine cleavage system aminomethyltransferase GcvT n=1 Tax=Catalinimonas niigatensis TaxID=1397264 RepID=UPI0026662875|nr:glycine cleavage system aminomethyltransferase GcvT [Catalinimonas niigatensis]WPP53510.1 glycine cleavage system aminomethyltransferase GcvT [Catalinimonas niigatensis]